MWSYCNYTEFHGESQSATEMISPCSSLLPLCLSVKRFSTVALPALIVRWVFEMASRESWVDR